MSWKGIIKNVDKSFISDYIELFQKTASELGHPHLIHDIELEPSGYMHSDILFNFKIKGKEIQIIDEQPLAEWIPNGYKKWDKEKVKKYLESVIRSFALLGEVVNNPSVRVEGKGIIVTGAKGKEYIIYPQMQLNDGCHKLYTHPNNHTMCIAMDESQELLPVGDNLATLILTLLNDDKTDLDGLRDYNRGDIRWLCDVCGTINDAPLDELRPAKLIQEFEISYNSNSNGKVPIFDGFWKDKDLAECKNCSTIHELYDIKYYPELWVNELPLGIFYMNDGKINLISRGNAFYDAPTKTFTIMRGPKKGYKFGVRGEDGEPSELTEPEDSESGPYEMYKQKYLSSKGTNGVNMKWVEYLKKSPTDEEDWENSLKSIISEGKKLGVPLSVMELLKLAKEATTSQSEGFETLHRPTFDEEEEEDV